ncbi:multicopper oxidase domain-containing protein [Streptomyces sp. NPDC047860]|uniref:multicopper oxidase domain-containing protein n=1 Tax=Streptomyces sp. NPDC047860 TaxID=3155743 RepID=UPI0033EFE3B5
MIQDAQGMSHHTSRSTASSLRARRAAAAERGRGRARTALPPEAVGVNGRSMEMERIDETVTMKLALRFTGPADPDTPYMYHCHLLYHGDEGMMGQFVVVDKGQSAGTPPGTRGSCGQCGTQGPWTRARGRLNRPVRDPSDGSGVADPAGARPLSGRLRSG